MGTGSQHNLKVSIFRYVLRTNNPFQTNGLTCNTGADPGFLEKGIRMFKGMGVRFADFN